MQLRKLSLRHITILVLCLLLLITPAMASEITSQWFYAHHEKIESPVFFTVGSKYINVINPEQDLVFQIMGLNNWCTVQKATIETYGIECGASFEQHGVYVGLAQQGTSIIKFDAATHAPLAELSMPENITGQTMLPFGDQVIILGSDQLWTVSIPSFDQVELLACDGLTNQSIRSAAIYEQYLATAASDGTLSVLAFDENEYRLDAQCHFDTPPSTLFINRDYQRYGLVYGQTENSLDVWNYFLHDGSIAKADELQWPAELQQVWYVNGGIYAQDAAGDIWRNNFYATEFRSSTVYDHALLIANDFISAAMNDSAIELFHDVYPHTTLSASNMGNALGNATVLQSEQFDLLSFLSGQFDLPNLVRSGAIVPLDEYPAIAAANEELLDLQNLCSYNHQQYIIPTSIKIHVWEANPALFEKTGIALPQEGWTVEQFFQMGEELAAYNQREGTNYILLYDNMETSLPYLLKMALVNAIDYGSQAFSLDSEAFQALTSRYRDMVQRGLIGENKSGDRKTSSRALFQVYRLMDFNDLEEATIVFPPVENETTRYLMDVGGVALGSRSAYPDEAAQFIAALASPENVLRQQAHGLGPILADQDKWQTEDHRSMLKPSAETTAVWQQMACKGVWNDLGQDAEYSLRMDIYPRLADGTIDAATFTDHLIRTLRMMLQE